MTPITDDVVRARLTENGLEHVIWPLQGDAFAIVAARGGRIFGPFAGPGAASELWLNPAFLDPPRFRALLDARYWNLGGERNWIAPEIQYITLNRTDPNQVHIPEAMDPGAFELAGAGQGEWELHQRVTMEARNVAQGWKTLELSARLRRAANPLRSLAACDVLMAGVQYAGYEQIVTLTDAEPNAVMSETWNFAQLNPGGELFVSAPAAFELADYATEPLRESHYCYDGRRLRFKITGDCMYKVGLQSACFSGRVGYLRRQADGTASLIVRNFFNNPSSFYVEEPANRPGRWGDSLHVYNDGGRWGGFGELEVHGQTIGGPTGNRLSRDAMQLWFFWGPAARVAALAELLV